MNSPGKFDPVAQLPVFCLAPGLYHYAPSPERPWKVHQPPGTEAQWTICGSSPLRPLDLRVWSALVAMAHWTANQEWIRFPFSDPGDAALHRGLALRPNPEPRVPTVAVVRTSWSALAREVRGAPMQSSVLRGSVAKWQATRITKLDIQRSSRTLFWDESSSDDYRRPVTVVLNPFVSQIQHVAHGGVSYTLLSMEDMRQLSDAALLIYVRCCGFINRGDPKTLMFETFHRYLWGPVPSPSDRNERHRRGRTRDALAELQTIGWQIEGPQGPRANYRIQRPAEPGTAVSRSGRARNNKR